MTEPIELLVVQHRSGAWYARREHGYTALCADPMTAAAEALAGRLGAFRPAPGDSMGDDDDTRPITPAAKRIAAAAQVVALARLDPATRRRLVADLATEEPPAGVRELGAIYLGQLAMEHMHRPELARALAFASQVLRGSITPEEYHG